ncbi:1,2-dihydroxy-3-keto-5-methylthiopentene dioxygenase [Lujinxingia vulgaris]|nr:cupin domain-containing protein [Lujinxingia vulgaris]
MAELRVRGTDEVLTDAAAIDAFVKGYGLGYERWDISKLHTEEARAMEAQSEQERILKVFADEIAALKERGGYQSADVIALTPETPNLDALLAKFDKEHEHTEDEVRFVVDGRGVFTIHGEDDKVFDVEVHPGDLLVVPQGTWHWFDLCEDKTITCIRVFESKDGWVAHYRA